MRAIAAVLFLSSCAPLTVPVCRGDVVACDGDDGALCLSASGDCLSDRVVGAPSCVDGEIVCPVGAPACVSMEAFDCP